MYNGDIIEQLDQLQEDNLPFPFVYLLMYFKFYCLNKLVIWQYALV